MDSSPLKTQPPGAGRITWPFARPWQWVLSAVSAISTVLLWRAWRAKTIVHNDDYDAQSVDPGLLRKHTTYEAFTTRTATYPRIRTFYHAHPQAAKLPDDLPLLVFLHGLGGSVAQFAPLLTSLVNVAPCLAIDLPGAGLSDFKPNEVEAYTIAAFTELVAAAVQRYQINGQRVVFVVHSMGCSIGALLVSSASPLALPPEAIGGLIAIAPRSTPPTSGQMRAIKRLRWLPPPVFDFLRIFDSIGGVNSASVTRFAGVGADLETRRLQLRYNRQSKSKVVLRYVIALALSSDDGRSDFPGKEVWSGVRAPLFLVAGAADSVNTPLEASAIADWLTSVHAHAKADTSTDPASPVDNDTSVITAAAGDVQLASDQLTSSTSHGKLLDSNPPGKVAESTTSKSGTTAHHFAIKSTTFPAPASHGLLYATATVRVLSGLIQTFLAHHVDKRLDLGWQLQHLTTTGKWDVKNLLKWQKIDPCSDPIAGVFRAMKTMREVDESHNPTAFAARYSADVLPDGVAMVVDISHESPVYDPNGLEAVGIEYHKFPTVSKLPPSADEVASFINLIDHLRESPRLQLVDCGGGGVRPVIGVHCHYGFNRTGFFIVCYLVERCGYRLQDAVEEFAQKRTPGIKHEHFVNELFVRYAVKMERRGTIVG